MQSISTTGVTTRQFNVPSRQCLVTLFDCYFDDGTTSRLCQGGETLQITLHAPLSPSEVRVAEVFVDGSRVDTLIVSRPDVPSLKQEYFDFGLTYVPEPSTTAPLLWSIDSYGRGSAAVYPLDTLPSALDYLDSLAVHYDRSSNLLWLISCAFSGGSTSAISIDCSADPLVGVASFFDASDSRVLALARSSGRLELYDYKMDALSSVSVPGGIRCIAESVRAYDPDGLYVVTKSGALLRYSVQSLSVTYSNTDTVWSGVSSNPSSSQSQILLLSGNVSDNGWLFDVNSKAITRIPSSSDTQYISVLPSPSLNSVYLVGFSHTTKRLGTYSASGSVVASYTELDAYAIPYSDARPTGYNYGIICRGTSIQTASGWAPTPYGAKSNAVAAFDDSGNDLILLRPRQTSVDTYLQQAAPDASSSTCGFIGTDFVLHVSVYPEDAYVPITVPKSIRASVFVNGILQQKPVAKSGDTVVVKSSDPSFQSVFYAAVGRSPMSAIFDQEPDRVTIQDVYDCDDGGEYSTIPVTPTGYVQTDVIYYGDVIVDGVRRAAPVTLLLGQSISFVFDHDGEHEDHSVTFGSQVVMFRSHKSPAPKFDSALRNRAYARLNETYLSGPIRNTSGRAVTLEVLGGRLVGPQVIEDNATFQVAVDTGSTPAHIETEIRADGLPLLHWSVWSDVHYLDPVNVRVEPVGSLVSTHLPFSSVPDGFYFDFTVPEGVLSSVSGVLYSGTLDCRGLSASRRSVLDATNKTSVDVSFYPQLSAKMLEFGDAIAYVQVMPIDTPASASQTSFDLLGSELPDGQSSLSTESASSTVGVGVYSQVNSFCAANALPSLMLGQSLSASSGDFELVLPDRSSADSSSAELITEELAGFDTHDADYISFEAMDTIAPGVSLVEFGTSVSTASVVRLVRESAASNKSAMHRLLEDSAASMSYTLSPMLRPGLPPSITGLASDSIAAGTLVAATTAWLLGNMRPADAVDPKYRFEPALPTPTKDPEYSQVDSMFAAYEHEAFSDYQWVHGMYSRRLFSAHRQTDTASRVQLFTLQFEVRGIYEVTPRNFHFQERYPDLRTSSVQRASMRYPDQGLFSAEYIQRQYAFSAEARAQLVLPYIQSQRLLVSDHIVTSSMFHSKSEALYVGSSLNYGHGLSVIYSGVTVNTVETPEALPYQSGITDYTFDGVIPDTSYVLHIGVEDLVENGFFQSELDALQNAVSVWGMDPGVIYAIKRPSGLWAWSQATAFNNLCSPMPKGYVSGG